MGTNETPPPKPTRPPTPASPPSRLWKEPERELAARAASAALPPRQGLVISKRLLWVHGGAYPLENIVRVYTFMLRPRRAEAFIRFLKRGGFTLALYLLLTFVSDSSSGPYGSSSSDADGFLGLARILALAMLIYFGADSASVIFAGSHDVLAIETNGRSTAMVTGKREYLNQLVRQVAEAIDKPDAEFQAPVGALTITNYGDYFFGDTVNMYGGSGNTGVAK
ncbi:DUF6232 family protein [Streptomyces sp. NPDC056194]|uniref:DUF6232 family protein n=1 Tax=unclassified Streptomyces TaxID=2593676 RepID=UPI0035DF58F3